MFRKQLSLFLAIIMVFSVGFLTSGHDVEAVSDKSTIYEEPIVQDIGSYLRYLDKNEDLRKELDEKLKLTASEFDFNNLIAEGEMGIKSTVGDTKVFLGLDTELGYYYFKFYTLKSIGDKIEIWVADNISFPEDSGREDPVITQEQLDMMRDEFDSNIYPGVTSFFGDPNSHTGEFSLLEAWGYVPPGYYSTSPEEERVIMLVDNVRDERYYDEEYPFYIAGFYSPTYEAYFDRNIITIDTREWEERLESIYYGVTAHELQHLIHDDNDPYETIWLNEGMSDFAEYICGYGHPESHVEFFLQHPENSLVEWDDQYSADTGPETLADYGQAYLLTLYMYDKYGPGFVEMLAKDTDQGFASIEKLLSCCGDGIDFGELFRRFSIAVAIDSYMPGEGIYEFNSIDVNVDFESAMDYDKDGVPAWGGDYKIIKNAARIENIIFDGIEFMPVDWIVVDKPLYSGNNVLWGNEGNGLDNELIFPADLSSVTEAALNFDTYIDIEENWDAGFVQVSTDGGATWTSLANPYTVSDPPFIFNPDAPEIYNNLPGLTGYSGDWMNMEFDLTPYAGMEVLINFRYMTDLLINWTGWYIDNIAIPEIGYLNTCDSLEGFMSMDEINEIHVEYAVAFINKKSLGAGRNTSKYNVLNVDPFDVSEEETVILSEFFEGGANYMIIWYAAPEGKIGVADYSYEIIRKNDIRNRR